MSYTTCFTYFCVGCNAELDVCARSEDEAADYARNAQWVFEDGGMMRTWCGMSCIDNSAEHAGQSAMGGL